MIKVEHKHKPVFKLFPNHFDYLSSARKYMHVSKEVVHITLNGVVTPTMSAWGSTYKVGNNRRKREQGRQA